MDWTKEETMATALILNGSLQRDARLDQAQELLSNALQQKGWVVEAMVLRDVPIAACRGCFGCWLETPGLCVQDDAGRDVAREFIRSDLVVLVTPITFGGYSSELKKALDRCLCTMLPFFTKVGGEVRHKLRYDRYPALLGVGVLAGEDGESEAIFKTLVARNALNYHSPAHAAGVVRSSQGGQEVAAQMQALLDQVGVGQ
jgi:multimeric flavodoxin WrbA